LLKILYYIITENSSGDHQAKRRKDDEKPKPGEREGMLPKHQHCPPAKCRGDRNPKYRYHEE
jgi:hypothetical protein